VSRTPKECRRKPAVDSDGRQSALKRRRARTDARPLLRLVMRLGKTLIGVLPRSRRIRAANDPLA
jgi:hypothetical protein